MSTIMQTHQQETQFKETTTLTLKLSCSPSQTDHATNCWNFLELTKPSPKFTPYIPPPTTTSYAKSPLSYVTFDLCTENLGSESGSDMSDHDIDNILSLSPVVPLMSRDQPKLMMMKKKKVGVPSRSFPPPLTTIRGFNPIRVRSKREGGRLVIDAVEERSVACNYFRSDRTNGRLRLSFWDNCITNTKEDEETEETGEVNGNVVREEDMIGNSLEVGVEIGTQKFQRSSRCMEGNNNNNNKGLRHWETLLVAT